MSFLYNVLCGGTWSQQWKRGFFTWPINSTFWHWFERMCDSYSFVRFPNFSEDLRQTNCGVQLRIDRPTILKWNSRHGHVQFCRISASKCFFNEQLSLDLAHLRRPTRWTVVLFQAHMLRAMIRHLSHDNLALSVHARHQCSLAQRPFLTDLHGPGLLASVSHDWIH